MEPSKVQPEVRFPSGAVLFFFRLFIDLSICGGLTDQMDYLTKEIPVSYERMFGGWGVEPV